MRPIVFALALVLTACATSTPRNGASALLDRAVTAAGGTTALDRARTLHWTGTATVFDGTKRIDLGVDTVVRPFVRSDSATWLRDRPADTRREMVIEGDRGWIVRDGQRQPMSEGMLANERLQYAVYGLMRLVTLRDAGTRIEARPDRDGLKVLHVQHPRAAPADLLFDADGRLVALENRVPNAEGAGDVAQRFDFEGTITDDGVRWPRTLRIAQDGKPFFELTLATLDVAP